MSGKTEFIRPNIVIDIDGYSSIKDMSQIELTTFWEPLIIWLADKFPKWKIEGHSVWQIDSTRCEQEAENRKYCPRRWSVHCDGEELGSLSRGEYGGKPCYTIDNFRISNKRERGHADKTTKLDRAKKLILKNFRPKDLKELMDKARTRVWHSVDSNGYIAESNFQTHYQRLSRHLMDHVMSNLDTLMEIAVKDGFDRVEELNSTYEDYYIKGRLRECARTKNTGAVVLIHGDTYAVETDGGQFSTYENATLPDLLKVRVGMLKLIENGQTLLDVGYRENEREFYVSLEEDNGPT